MSLPSNFSLNLLRILTKEIQIQLYWQVDSSHFDFQRKILLLLVTHLSPPKLQMPDVSQ